MIKEIQPSKNLLLLLTIMIAVFSILKCSDEVVQSTLKSSFYQVKGCNKVALGKVTGESPCFNYTFNEKLVLEFCVSGNCCPDSNRFETRALVEKDTITITVKDIAPNLCKCMCNYFVHGEIESLQAESYTVKCLLDEGSSFKLLYLETVKR